MIPAAVIDTSFFMAALFPVYTGDEQTTAMDFIADIVEDNGQLYVPQVFWFEVGNVLCTASREKKNGEPARLSAKQVLEIEQILKDLPIYTEPQPDTEIRSRIREFAMSYSLSYYDAAYLELALRHDLPLKTFDSQLQAAFEQM